jgi:hypothetical protein
MALPWPDVAAELRSHCRTMRVPAIEVKDGAVALLKRLRVEPRRLVEQPLRRLAHPMPVEGGLGKAPLHAVADPDRDAGIPEGRHAQLILRA